MARWLVLGRGEIERGGGSYHTNTTFKAIPSGVFKYLAKHTSQTASNSSLQIDEIYPDHANALKMLV